jgi:hypothetical protein
MVDSWSSAPMSSQTPENVSAPTPIHNALDRLTVAVLELQRLQRQADQGESLPPDELAGSLDAVTSHLRELGAILTAIRNEAT